MTTPPPGASIQQRQFGNFGDANCPAPHCCLAHQTAAAQARPQDAKHFVGGVETAMLRHALRRATSSQFGGKSARNSSPVFIETIHTLRLD